MTKLGHIETIGKLAQIESIMEYWADGDSDGIDDLDALCQIAEVLGIEVQARETVENPHQEMVYCPRCTADQYDANADFPGFECKVSHLPPAHTLPPEQQSPRVCMKCNHAEHWSSNHHHRCAFLYTSMDGGSTCSCMCVFPESVEEET